jgi:hypothetical protein
MVLSSLSPPKTLTHGCGLPQKDELPCTSKPRGGWGEAAAVRGKKERCYCLSVGIGRQDPISGSDRMAKIVFSDFRESSVFRLGSRLPSRHG